MSAGIVVGRDIIEVNAVPDALSRRKYDENPDDETWNQFPYVGTEIFEHPDRGWLVG